MSGLSIVVRSSRVVAVVGVAEAIAVVVVVLDVADLFLVVCTSMSGIYGFCHEVREENTGRDKLALLCAGALKQQQHRATVEQQQHSNNKRLSNIVHTTYSYMVCGCYAELNRTSSARVTGKISSPHAPPPIFSAEATPLLSESRLRRPPNSSRCCWRTVACMIAKEAHTNNLNSSRRTSLAPEVQHNRRKCSNEDCSATLTHRYSPSLSLLKPNRKSVTPTSKLKKHFTKYRRNISVASTCLTSTGKSPTSSTGTRCRSCSRR